MTTDRQKTLNTIKTLVATKHVTVDPEVYAEWASTLDRVTPDLLTASPADFQQTIHSLLATFQTSHTGFLKPDAEMIPLRHALCATARKHPTADGERWVFQDVIEDGPADLAGIKPGDLLLAKDGVPIFAADNPRFGFGGTYSFDLGNLNGTGPRTVSVTVPNKPAKDRPPMIEPKALSFRQEEGIPVLKVTTFPGAVGLRFAKELDSIVGKLTAENSDRLIVDLRGNIGGGLASLRLMSYLCPDRRPIGYSLTKRHIQKGTKPADLPRINRLPESKLSQLGMFVRFRFVHKDRSLVLETEGLGPRPFHGHIVMLINEHTHSAAEMVAAFAKENRLATLVGTTTAGEVMGGATFTAGEGYRLRIPVTTWQTWGGMQIEKKGVTPDILVEFRAEETGGSKDSQLQVALKTVREPA
jgi:C-terminal processing protease CtpA/Prc